MLGALTKLIGISQRNPRSEANLLVTLVDRSASPKALARGN